jgi:hypothetical protein
LHFTIQSLSIMKLINLFTNSLHALINSHFILIPKLRWWNIEIKLEMKKTVVIYQPKIKNVLYVEYMQGILAFTFFSFIYKTRKLLSEYQHGTRLRLFNKGELCLISSHLPANWFLIATAICHLISCLVSNFPTEEE